MRATPFQRPLRVEWCPEYEGTPATDSCGEKRVAAAISSFEKRVAAASCNEELAAAKRG
jgi:hypothetical protein